MNRNAIGWLRGEIEAWVADGTVDRATAARIAARYAKAGHRLAWSVLLFAGLGAAIVGVGIILLLAYNWQEIPRFGKLGLLGGGMLAAHGAGLWLRSRGPNRHQLAEALFLFGTMLFGAAIWLVAQAYHIDEHYPQGFLVWGLGALALGLALPSVAHGWLATAVLTIWGVSESSDFGQVMHGAPASILFGVGAIAVMTRSRSLPIAMALSLGVLLIAEAGMLPGNAGWILVIHYGALLIGVAAFLQERPGWRGPARVLGVLGGWASLGALYLLTFEDLGEEAVPLSFGSGPGSATIAAYVYGTLLLAVLVFGVVARRDGIGRTLRSGAVVVLGAGMVVHVLTMLIDDKRDLAGLTVPINLMLLSLGIYWMVRGCREGEARATIDGCLLFLAISIARFFDLFESLVHRGIAFVIVGGILFAVGVAFTRSSRTRHERELQP